jgi:hypothetical protein
MHTFTLTGQTPLLMHANDIEARDMLDEWRKDAKNKNKSKPGDDRTPPWTWLTYCYHDGVNLAVPCDNLQKSLSEAGASVILKKQLTYKSMMVSGLMFAKEHMTLTVAGKKIKYADLVALRDLEFKEQANAVRGLGFRLLLKPVVVTNKSHIRVRPCFDDWTLTGEFEIVDKDLGISTVREIFEIAGQRRGLCDWRPGSPKRPGTKGRFTAKIV